MGVQKTTRRLRKPIIGLLSDVAPLMGLRKVKGAESLGLSFGALKVFCAIFLGVFPKRPLCFTCFVGVVRYVAGVSSPFV